MAQVPNFDAVEWYWQIEPVSKYLELVLAQNIHFLTSFRKEEIINLEHPTCRFTTADACQYSSFRDKFRTLPLNQEQQFRLAVNATVAERYAKPQASKSWYFRTKPVSDVLPFEVGDYVTLQTERQGVYMVLNMDEVASTLMLVSAVHKIDEQRTYCCGKTVRVHNDRVSSHPFEIQEHQL